MGQVDVSLSAGVKSKRGFSIVELLIVLAVIAILAAVCIPVFSNVISNADRTAKVASARNLNLVILTESVAGNTPSDMSEAVALAISNGCTLGELDASGNSSLLWDSQRQLFCVYDGISIEYPGSSGSTEAHIADEVHPELWGVYFDAPTEQRFSIYWASESYFADTLTVGFDAGDNKNAFCINFDGTLPCVIKTNGQSINASGEVSHYGDADKVTLNNAVYYEYGSVAKITAADSTVTACSTSVFAETLSEVRSNVGTVIVEDGAKFAAEPEHTHKYGSWLNNGKTHIRYCTECGDTETGEHGSDAICPCGHTTLPAGLYLDGSLDSSDDSTFVSWEYLIDNGYITYQDDTKCQILCGEGFVDKYKDRDCVLVVNESVTMISYLNEFSSLTEVVIPYGVTCIDQNAFFNCKKLTRACLPMSVESIGKNAFNGTALAEVAIGENVQNIGQNAFAINNATIYCSAFESKPDAWNDKWCDTTAKVVWKTK